VIDADAGAGDVNGDGVSDMLVGAYGADALGRSGAGVVYVIFGRNTTWPATLDLVTLTVTDGMVLQGAAGGDETGWSVASADVNGDGIPDMLMGAYQASPLGRLNTGVAYVIFGRSGSWPATFDLAMLTATDGLLLQGVTAGDYTGISVANAGDINGDGATDILVGAYRADPLGRTDAGNAYVIFGQRQSVPTPTPSPTPTPTPFSTPTPIPSSTPPVISTVSSSIATQTVLPSSSTISLSTSDSNSNPSPKTTLWNSSKMGSSNVSPTNISSSTKLKSQPYASTTYSSVKSSTKASASITMDYVTASAKKTSSPISFVVIFSEVPIVINNLDEQVFITSKDLDVGGININPSQVIYTVSDKTGLGIIIEVEGAEATEFTQADVDAGFVSFTITDEYCEGDVELYASNGIEPEFIRVTMEISADVDNCGARAEASRLAEKSALKGITLLMVSSGLGFFAKQHREKVSSVKMSPLSDETKTDNEVYLSNLKSGY